MSWLVIRSCFRWILGDLLEGFVVGKVFLGEGC